MTTGFQCQKLIVTAAVQAGPRELSWPAVGVSVCCGRPGINEAVLTD